MGERTVHAVLPADVDDPARVSGGNVYDRRVLDGLRALGHGVVEHAAPGSWPRPDAVDRAALARTLDGIDDGATVLVDGLVSAGVPEVLVPRAGRIALAVLVHLPMGVEPASADLAAGEGAVLRAARVTVATSAWAARRLRTDHGVDAHVVNPGTDPAPLTPGTDGRSQLVCVGALTPTKGQDLLVDALPEGLSCDLVGPTSRDPAFVAELRRRIGTRAGITLTGPRDRDAAYRHADLVVVPSRHETYGMVVTEALARGIPVLAADVGGLATTLDGAGTLIPAESVTALAVALLQWRDDHDHRDGLRLSARSSRCRLTPWTQTSRRLAAVLPAP